MAMRTKATSIWPCPALSWRQPNPGTVRIVDASGPDQCKWAVRHVLLCHHLKAHSLCFPGVFTQASEAPEWVAVGYSHKRGGVSQSSPLLLPFDTHPFDPHPLTPFCPPNHCFGWNEFHLLPRAFLGNLNVFTKNFLMMKGALWTATGGGWGKPNEVTKQPNPGGEGRAGQGREGEGQCSVDHPGPT